jgi:Tol biopolymer transport system component
MIKKIFKKIFCTLLIFSPFCIFGQSTDLSVRFIGAPPPQVGIGEAFAIQAEAFHVDANSSPVVNEAITITLELIDPNGIVIATHVQSPGAFPNPAPAASAQLDNDATNTNQVILQMPWTEGTKWNPNNPVWTVTVRVSSPSLESNTANNSVSHTFTLILPDLEVPGDSVTLLALDPITGDLTNNILPNSQIQVFGSITNIGSVMTQPGARFTVDARLFEGTVTASGPASISLSVDRESVILPPSDGSSPTSVLPGASINYVIPNLKLPADAVGTYTVQVNVDPADLATGQIIQEIDGINNNHLLTTFTVGQGTPNLEVNPNSFDGDIGIFRGLDPIRIAFSIRNTGNVPVGATDAFTARVALSNNDTFSNDDFILREFNIGGIALGTNLRSNETIRLDWIQQLPDNFEGDYYLITDILNENTNARTTFPLQNTPVITMVSKGKGTTELVEPGAVLSTERPHASSDGMVVVYEQTGGNGIQQIFLKDMVSGQITRISNASVTNAGGNGDSLRPRISADGSTVVFHSFANDLIVGDSNGHSDVFVYKVDTQLLIRAHQSSTGQDGNGGSFYPAVSGDGNVVVFESRATNLPSTGETTKGRQIFLWNLTAVGMGSIQALTYGNGESRGASVDQSGNLVTFSSYATNLTTKSDTNSKEDVFLKRIDTNDTFLVSRTMLGRPADGGNSWNPKISGDGSAIVFQSSATNMVFGKGVSKIEVERSGAGYFGSPTATITDLEGTGAVISLQNALDVYGQIREEAIEILAHGSGYFMPQVTILPDPAQPPPTQTAQVNALLSHSQGEIYRILVDDVTDPDDNPSYSQRASENEYAVGGDMESREPSISYDGQSVVYATKSTNLQDTNITRDDGKVYYNKPGRIASAQAILVGGIGEIEVLSPGLGYQNGFLEITDLSGSGKWSSCEL